MRERGGITQRESGPDLEVSMNVHRAGVVWRVLSLLVGVASPIAAAEGPLSPPSGGVITLDGTLASEEWEGATRVEGEAELFLSMQEDVLQIGVRAPEMLVASLCVLRDETVFVLHASAALGRASYVQEPEGWRLQEPFEWELRTTELTEAAQAERSAYLDANGWVATTTKGPAAATATGTCA